MVLIFAAALVQAGNKYDALELDLGRYDVTRGSVP